MHARWRLAGGAVLLAAVASLAALPAQKQPRAAVPVSPTPAPVSTWKEIDRLIQAQQMAEASRRTDEILARAIQSKDEADWTRALIRSVQLRTGLHGYETAVRFLKEQPWPGGLRARASLELFYAQALVTYSAAYSWEIGKRERVESSGPMDLKAWTREQIYAEAERAYASVWKKREALGSLPVGRLSEYVEPNNYPPEVRGTLRDAVSYLFVELCADSSLWTPEQSNDAYRLDFAGLLAADGRDADARLADPRTHPVAKLVAVLGDLEAWHAGAGRREAELEARLERLRRLHSAFSEETDRTSIRKDLEERLPRYRAVSWWSMGMAELAGFREAEDTPENLIRARDVAIAGFQAYPSSPGGRRCSDIITSTEAPEYQVASMSSDGMDRRSIQVTHRNLSRLYFRAYAMDLEKRITGASDSSLLPEGEDVRRLLRAETAAVEWSVDLPATADYKAHRTFVTPPMRQSGLYVVVASVRKEFAQADNLVASVAILISDLVLVTRTESSAVEVRVLSGTTGLPVAGAEVSRFVYDWSSGKRHHRLETRVSGADGLVRFEYGPGEPERMYFFVARNGKDFALDPTYVSLQAPKATADTTASLVYTDRSIYRPLQKILWKVVAYHGPRELGRFHTAASLPVTVTLQDANEEVVESKTVTTNSFGSAAGEFVIPSGRALGGWRVETSLSGDAEVQVEEYKRPTFEVKWADPKTPLRLNQPAALQGSARYYFGLPVANGTVRWRVTREAQFPAWWSRWGTASATGAQTVAQGTSKLDGDGAFGAAFTPAADERLAGTSKDVTYRFTATVDVTDEGGETRSDKRGFRLGFVAVEAQARTDVGFFLEGIPPRLTLVRTDLDGAPRAGRGSWRLLAIREPEKTLLPAEMPVDETGDDRFATSGDRLRPRWDSNVSLEAALRSWPDGAEKASGDVTHDARGEAALSLPALAAGAWRLRYETRDDFGAESETTKDFLVAGRKMPVRFPGVLLAERSSVRVGERARLLAFSGLPDQTLFFQTLRDGKVVRAGRSWSSDETPIEIPGPGGRPRRVRRGIVAPSATTSFSA